MAPAWTPGLQVLHELPGRCRLRVMRLRVDGIVREHVERRLTASPLVANFRFNLSCDSVTIDHEGPLEVLVALLRAPASVARLEVAESRALVVQPQSLGSAQPLKSLAWAGASLLLAPIAGSGLALLTLVITSLPIWRRAVRTLLDERRLNVDFLDGLALAIALLRQQPRTGALMALLVHLGDVVRERTAGQSRGQIRELLDFQTVQARRMEADGSVTLVPAQRLCSGQLTLLLAGDLVPADGRVTGGLASVDQRHITGESAPATRRSGDLMFAGSSVVEGSITLEITAAGDDTAVAKLVKLVQSAPVGETRIQNYAENFADRLVAPLLGVNVALLAATGNVDRFMSLAIVDYGTGIRVAAPTSVLSSMTRAARQGIVIKSGRHVELLANLQGIAFDKTGTLTCGHMVVLDVRTYGTVLGAGRLLQLAAAAEAQLRHPVARALVTHVRDVLGLGLPLCTNVQFAIGLGVSADVAGHHLQIGSERFLRGLGIATSAARTWLLDVERHGHAAVLVALDGRLAGVIACNDAPRPEARAVIAGLRQRGVHNIVMLTGDRDGVAQRIARAVGIDRVYSEVLPQDKSEMVRRLRAAGGPFAMVGDGVNDSPALAEADVGIALVDGADIARAAADVVLMEEGLHQLLPAIDISRDALSLVRQNYTLIAGANTLALALALPSGWMSPVACTLLSNGAAVLAALNAMRPLLMARRDSCLSVQRAETVL
jgi:Cu2+-exporting ATPase